MLQICYSKGWEPCPTSLLLIIPSPELRDGWPNLPMTRTGLSKLAIGPGVGDVERQPSTRERC